MFKFTLLVKDQTKPTFMKTDFDYNSYQLGEKYGRKSGFLLGILIGVTIMVFTMIALFYPLW
tara:strand:- start:87 stop:272 length:186 start_codon:yes stop_codon:yes gene_type:complete